MSSAPEPSDEELIEVIAYARSLFGTEMNIQAPPNLTGDILFRLIRAGINDWGGVSPVTNDAVNPEKSWPLLSELQDKTEAAGRILKERLPVYPKYISDTFLHPRVRKAAERLTDGQGYVKNVLDGRHV